MKYASLDASAIFHRGIEIPSSPRRPSVPPFFAALMAAARPRLMHMHFVRRAKFTMHIVPKIEPRDFLALEFKGPPTSTICRNSDSP